MSPVKDTNTSIDRAMSLNASVAGSLKTSLSSDVNIDSGGVLGAELPLDDAGVCLMVDLGKILLQIGSKDCIVVGYTVGSNVVFKVDGMWMK